MPDHNLASYLQGGRAVQRTWLTATGLGVAFHPMTAMPYLLARLTLGEGRGLEEGTIAELTRLLPRYRALVPVQGSHVMLFRLAIAGPPAEWALRRSLSECFFEAATL